ncbi:hypothetical protein B0T14DRAFT_567713 [Immersiella caudata]|uniref:Tat pathway signal sequence n=1 Tax=Immersiella caudata TaxID=314043 RepID=A0AA39WSW7_9PEZI|nr:hypothetical protein B0T14DRAFT_567713 [Immersiella caudata]
MFTKKELGTDSRSSSSDLEDGDREHHRSLLSNGEHAFDKHKALRSEKRQNRRNWALLSAHVFLFLLEIGLILMVAAPKIGGKDDEAVQLPHHEWIASAIEWEVRTYDDRFGIHGPFRGKPRPELDAAWGDMVRNYTVRIPKPGWRNPSSPDYVLAEFQDEEGGIMGTFSFLHNLHCIKTIRQYLLPEDYPETAEMYKATPEQPIPRHIDHCFDILRQSELCHADMSLLVFEWHKDDPLPVSLHHAQHICANTEKVNRFLEANTVPPFGSILVHPWTGKSPY